jgi:hypothetical protein
MFSSVAHVVDEGLNNAYKNKKRKYVVGDDEHNRGI